VTAVINTHTDYFGRHTGREEFYIVKIKDDTGILNFLEGIALNDFNGLVS
jgi:hypothetical protein